MGSKASLRSSLMCALWELCDCFLVTFCRLTSSDPLLLPPALINTDSWLLLFMFSLPHKHLVSTPSLLELSSRRLVPVWLSSGREDRVDEPTVGLFTREEELIRGECCFFMLLPTTFEA